MNKVSWRNITIDRYKLFYDDFVFFYDAFVDSVIDTRVIESKQLFDTTDGGSSNFTKAIGIKNIIEAIVANEHIELYDRCTSKP